MSCYDDDLYDLLAWGPIRTPKNENKNMEKKFAVWDKSCFKFKTYEDAEKEAKRLTGGARSGTEYVIAQAIASTIAPVPEIEVVKL